MNADPNIIVVGLISDTHGQLRSGVHAALAGVSLILHSGDVGGDEILDELRLIAPVQAVFGNTDDELDPNLVQQISVELGGVSIHVSHGHELGSPTPEKLIAAYSERVLVYGHTHKAVVIEADGRLVINPGAAGPPRFDSPPSIARLTIAKGNPEAAIVAID